MGGQSSLVPLIRVHVGTAEATGVLPDDALIHSLEAPNVYKRALFSLGDREQCPFHKVVYQAFVGFQSS